MPGGKVFEKKHQPAKPNDLLQRGKNLLGTVKIRNQDFCAEMILEPEDHLLVLPWWYNYCQDLRNRHSKGIQGLVNYKDIQKYILSEVELYRKRLFEKNIKMSDLEKELIEYKKMNT